MSQDYMHILSYIKKKKKEKRKKKENVQVMTFPQDILRDAANIQNQVPHGDQRKKVAPVFPAIRWLWKNIHM